MRFGLECLINSKIYYKYIEDCSGFIIHKHDSQITPTVIVVTDKPRKPLKRGVSVYTGVCLLECSWKRTSLLAILNTCVDVSFGAGLMDLWEKIF